MRINLAEHEVVGLIARDKRVITEVINKVSLLYLKTIMKKAKEEADAKMR